MLHHILPIISALFILALSGCEFQIPKQGSVSRGDAYLPTHNPDILTTTGNDATVGTTAPDDVSTSDVTGTLDPPGDVSHGDTITVVPPTVRTCTSDNECQNATINGTYECHDGVCMAPEIPCTSDFECADRNVCTGLEECYQGYCALGTRWNCDDGDPWTDDECNPATGCMYWPIYECLHDLDCEDPDLQCSSELGGTCVERDTCLLDADCGDPSQCTFDRCVVGRCENIDIVCYDFNPNTLDLCDPEMVGCYFPEMCYEDGNCVDLDSTTDSSCVEGECVHTRTHIYLSVLSAEYDGEVLDIGFGGVHWPGTLPYQMHLPFQDVCDTGLLIDVTDEDGACLPLDYDSIDVWSGLEQLDYIIVDDGCGGVIFVHQLLFGCIP